MSESTGAYGYATSGSYPTPQGARGSHSWRSKRARQRLTYEGPRGEAIRATVWLRYGVYLGIIVIGSAIAQACFSGINNAHSGGEWMLLSATFQIVVAAVGSFMFANRRPEINQQMRSYVFGYTIFPGTGIAVFMWAASHISAGPGGTDVFVNTLNAALPWLYFLPIILPSVIFVKSVAGMRSIHREQLDDQEIMLTYTRNDTMQR